MNWAIVRDPTVLATSAVYGLFAWIVSMAGLLGLPFAILLVFSIWRYPYELLSAVAQGHRRLPPPDVDTFNPIGKIVLFWHFAFFPGVVLAAMPYQPIGSVIVLAVAVAFPASVALMGLTGNLAQAFNPVGLMGFARTLGRDYWTLVAGFLGIIAGAFIIIGIVVPLLGWLSRIVFWMILFWALFASYALIGAALRHHRMEFEIAGEVATPEDHELKRRHDDWHRMLDIAYASFRGKLVGQGYKTLRELIEANDDSIEVNYWLVENMLDWHEKKYALEIAAKLMPRLLAKGAAADALDLYRRCRRRDPDFRLPAAEALELGRHAAAFGHTGLAAELGYNRRPSSEH